MTKDPFKSILSCLILAISLYGLPFVAVMSSVNDSARGLANILSSIFEPLNYLTGIFPTYILATLLTISWLYIAFTKTRPKRDSEARVLGFFTILLMVPHVALISTVGVFWMLN